MFAWIRARSQTTGLQTSDDGPDTWHDASLTNIETLNTWVFVDVENNMLISLIVGCVDKWNSFLDI